MDKKRSGKSKKKVKDLFAKLDSQFKNAGGNWNCVLTVSERTETDFRKAKSGSRPIKPTSSGYSVSGRGASESREEREERESNHTERAHQGKQGAAESKSTQTASELSRESRRVPSRCSVSHDSRCASAKRLQGNGRPIAELFN